MRNAMIVIGCLAAWSFEPGAHGAVIWNGPDVTFTKADFANPQLAANQDRITDDVWITRGGSQGIFNIKQESSYTHNSSPQGTQWATGSAENWQSLTFTSWEQWAGNNPPSTVGRPAVMHLVAEDIYLDVTFLSWSARTGGGFSYVRSSAPVPEPSSLSVLGIGILALAGRGRRRPRTL